MGFDFTFRTAASLKDYRAVIDFLSKQDLGYPGYQDWVQRAEAELLTGYKNVILGINGNRVVSDVMFQPHKQLGGRVIEVKNIRVDEQLRGRYFAGFMMRQLQTEVSEESDCILVDARSSPTDVISMLKSLGYVEVTRTPLYDTNEQDVVMTRVFDKRNKSGPISKMQRLFV